MPTDLSSNAPSTFFSYSRADSDFGFKLAKDRKAAGANVWIDQLDIEPGTPWDSSVEDALRNAPRMLVILSTVSVVSPNVRDEIAYALDRQKRIIPVLVSECDIPIRLLRLQHIDFRTDYGRGLRLLLKSLGVEAQDRTPTPAEVAAEKAKAERAELDRKAAEEKATQEEIQRKLLAGAVPRPAPVPAAARLPARPAPPWRKKWTLKQGLTFMALMFVIPGVASLLVIRGGGDFLFTPVGTGIYIASFILGIILAWWIITSRNKKA